MARTDAPTISLILLAIFFWDKCSVTRAEILHTAAAIDHAAPQEVELDRAILFLTQGELVEERDDAFRITAAGREILESSQRHSGNILDVWEALEQRIAALCAA